MPATVLGTTLLERTTGLYTFQIVDENSLGVALTLLTTLTLTYYDLASGTIVNSRQDQNALNANDVTVITDTGPPLVTTVRWLLSPADTAILNTANVQEMRKILFQWTWDSGNKRGAHEAQFTLENLLFVP